MNQYIREILNEYAKTRNRQKKISESKTLEIYKKFPKIKAVDMEINRIGLQLSKQILTNQKNAEKELNHFQEKVYALTQEKAFLLTESNIPLDYLELNYDCYLCKDTGFVKNHERCTCFKQQLINKAYDMSNLKLSLKNENFKTFDMDIFSNEPYPNKNLSTKENMFNILNICEGFVHNFDQNPDENLLFYGYTGLGKTFLCNCIAKALLDKGKIVLYQTTDKILEITEDYKFQKKSIPNSKESYAMLFQCDLLIIDDLGTELTNSYTNSELFNILNTRFTQKKKMIISTNLSPIDLKNTYSDRIFSRMASYFTILEFFGKDLRWQK